MIEVFDTRCLYITLTHMRRLLSAAVFRNEYYAGKFAHLHYY